MHIEVSNVSTLVRSATDQEIEYLTSYCSYEDRRPRRLGGQGRISLFDPTTYRFPSGFVLGLRRRAREGKFQLTIDDWRTRPCEPDPGVDLAWLAADKRYLWQWDALERCLKIGRGIVSVGTGGGKGSLIIAIAESLPTKWLCVVPSKDLLDQQAKRYEKLTGKPSGRIGDGVWDEREFTVATFQTLWRRLKAKDGAAIKLILETRGLLVDEVHSLPSSTLYATVNRMERAFFRLGFSATPLLRSDQRNIYTLAATGPVIYERKPDKLAEDGVVVLPNIRRLTIKHEPRNTTWQGVYRECVVSSRRRNALLVEMAKRCEKPAFLFVKAIEHGEALVSALRQAGIRTRFVWGAGKRDERQQCLDDLTSGKLEVLICSSLPYDELVLIRDKSGVALVKIGEVVENRLLNGRVEVWTRLLDGTDGWAVVSGGVKHPRNNMGIVETVLRGGARVLTTVNHSLIDRADQAVPPTLGTAYQQAVSSPSGSITVLDVCASLYDDHTLEIVVTGLTQARVRELKSELAYLSGESFGDSRTAKRAHARITTYNVPPETVREAIVLFARHVRYRKGKWRAAIPKNHNDFWWLNTIRLRGAIAKKHSGSRFRLPLSLAVTPALARLAGTFVAEGCSVNHRRANVKHEPLRAVIWAAKQVTAIDTRDGFREKAQIRKLICQDLRSTLGWSARCTDKQIILNGAIPYVLFQKVLCVGQRANTKRVPQFVWDSTTSIREAFLYGYFLGDGHLAPNRIVWTTVSRYLVVGVYYLLLSLGHRPTTTRDTMLHGKSRYRRYTVSVPRLLFGFMKPYQRRVPSRQPFAHATSIRNAPEHEHDEYVYDLCVPGVQRFYAGAGVLAHNTIFQTGIDLPSLRSVIVGSAGKSTIAAIQRVGRGCRVDDGKTYFEVWDVLDVGCGCKAVKVKTSWGTRTTGKHAACRWLEDHSRERRKAYEACGYTVADLEVI